MKAGTAARIARYTVILAVILFLSYPIIQLSTSSSEGMSLEVGVYADYDLEMMDQTTLEYNLGMVGDAGYEIVCGDERIQLPGADRSEVARRVMDSGAGTATVVDRSGNVVKQSNIRYASSIATIEESGFTLPDVLADRCAVEFSARLVGGGVSIPLDYTVEKVGSSFIMRSVIPYAVQYTAGALGCHFEYEFRLSYSGVVTGISGVDDLTYIPSGEFSSVGGGIVLSGDGGPGASSGTIGGADYTSVQQADGSAITITGGPDGAIESIVSGITGDGLEITAGDERLTVSKATADAWVEALKMLEGL